MFGFLGHTTNPRTGRPEPHTTWLMLRTAAWGGWGMAVVMIMFAALDYIRWGRLINLPDWLLAAAVFGAIGCAPYAVFKRKRRNYREAVVTYEAGLARAVRDAG